MDRQERLDIAKRQGVMIGTIYLREARGWTDRENKAGARNSRKRYRSAAPEPYVPKFGGDYTNGADLFLVLLFEVVKSIAKLPNEMDNYFLTCLVYKGLLDRGI